MSRPTSIVTKLSTAIEERLSVAAKLQGKNAETLRTEILNAEKARNFGLNSAQIVTVRWLNENDDSFFITEELSAIEKAEVTAALVSSIGNNGDTIKAAIAALQAMLAAQESDAAAKVKGTTAKK